MTTQSCPRCHKSIAPQDVVLSEGLRVHRCGATLGRIATPDFGDVLKSITESQKTVVCRWCSRKVGAQGKPGEIVNNSVDHELGLCVECQPQGDKRGTPVPMSDSEVEKAADKEQGFKPVKEQGELIVMRQALRDIGISESVVEDTLGLAQGQLEVPQKAAAPAAIEWTPYSDTVAGPRDGDICFVRTKDAIELATFHTASRKWDAVGGKRDITGVEAFTVLPEGLLRQEIQNLSKSAADMDASKPKAEKPRDPDAAPRKDIKESRFNPFRVTETFYQGPGEKGFDRIMAIVAEMERLTKNMEMADFIRQILESGDWEEARLQFQEYTDGFRSQENIGAVHSDKVKSMTALNAEAQKILGGASDDKPQSKVKAADKPSAEKPKTAGPHPGYQASKAKDLQKVPGFSKSVMTGLIAASKAMPEDNPKFKVARELAMSAMSVVFDGNPEDKPQVQKLITAALEKIPRSEDQGGADDIAANNLRKALYALGAGGAEFDESRSFNPFRRSILESPQGTPAPAAPPKPAPTKPAPTPAPKQPFNPFRKPTVPVPDVMPGPKADMTGEDIMESLTPQQLGAELKTKLNESHDGLSCDSPVSKSCDESDGVKRVYTQYVRDGNVFSPAGEVVLSPQLQPFAYNIKQTMQGILFEKVKPKTDELYTFESSVMSKVLAEIKKFWTLKENFKSLGLQMHRGILLYGPPGTGKTSLNQQVAEMMTRAGDVVFFVKSVGALREGLKAFRQVEPERRVVVIFEDVDECVGYAERDMLQLLDGEDTTTNVLFLGSTNYLERFPERLLRPGRFDKTIHLGPPPVEGRYTYLTHKLKNIEKPERIAELAKLSEGMSFGHLRELVIGIYALGEPANEVMARLKPGKQMPQASEINPFRIKESVGRHQRQGLNEGRVTPRQGIAAGTALVVTQDIPWGRLKTGDIITVTGISESSGKFEMTAVDGIVRTAAPEVLKKLVTEKRLAIKTVTEGQMGFGAQGAYEFLAQADRVLSAANNGGRLDSLLKAVDRLFRTHREFEFQQFSAELLDSLRAHLKFGFNDTINNAISVALDLVKKAVDTSAHTLAQEDRPEGDEQTPAVQREMGFHSDPGVAAKRQGSRRAESLPEVERPGINRAGAEAYYRLMGKWPQGWNHNESHLGESEVFLSPDDVGVIEDTVRLGLMGHAHVAGFARVAKPDDLKNLKTLCGDVKDGVNGSEKSLARFVRSKQPRSASGVAVGVVERHSDESIEAFVAGFKDTVECQCRQCQAQVKWPRAWVIRGSPEPMCERCEQASGKLG